MVHIIYYYYLILSKRKITGYRVMVNKPFEKVNASVRGKIGTYIMKASSSTSTNGVTSARHVAYIILMCEKNA